MRGSPKQAILGVKRKPGSRMEAHRACAQARFGGHLFGNSAVVGPQPFAGVDAENPVACGVAYCIVAHQREIVMPPVIGDGRPVISCDLPSAVAGSCVHDEHLVDDLRNKLQATGDVVSLVSCDQGCRY